jgi:hypothetical protein
MHVAPLKIHCQLVKVYGVYVMPRKLADMVHGFQQWQDRCWQVVTWAQSMSTADDAWCTDTFSCWELDSHWVVHRIVRDQLDYREVCVKQAPKNPTYDDKAHCMGLSCIHWTCYIDQRGQFWSWNMFNYTETRKTMCDRESISSPQQRKLKHCHQ